jgi:hypothetical protein
MDLSTVSTARTIIDPAQLGTSNFKVRANLSSGQATVSLFIDGGSTVTPAGPVFEINLGGITNDHSVKAIPRPFGGTDDVSGQRIGYITVLSTTARKVAAYQQDFRDYSPEKRWTYEWNVGQGIDAQLTATTANNVTLAWSPTLNAYTAANAAAYPDASTFFSYGRLTATGGWTGASIHDASNTPTFDRYAIAVYHVQADGYYGIKNGKVKMNVTGGGGIRLRILTEKADASQVMQLAEVSSLNVIGTQITDLLFGTPAIDMGLCKKGDCLLIAAGPRPTSNNADTSAKDGFTWDYDVWFNPTTNSY